MSEVVSSGEFIKKKCKKDFEELFELFKFNKENLRKRYDENFVELLNLFNNINVDRKDVEFERIFSVVFEKFFKSFPTCMPSRNETLFREINKK